MSTTTPPFAVGQEVIVLTRGHWQPGKVVFCRKNVRVAYTAGNGSPREGDFTADKVKPVEKPKAAPAPKAAAPAATAPTPQGTVPPAPAGSPAAAPVPAKKPAPKPLPRPAAKPAPACVACGDTGKDSKGGPCVPCVTAGRVVEAKPAPAQPQPAPAPAVQVETPAGAPVPPPAAKRLVLISSLPLESWFTMPEGGNVAGGQLVGLTEGEAKVVVDGKTQHWSTQTMVYPGKAPVPTQNTAPAADGKPAAAPRAPRAAGNGDLTAKELATLKALAVAAKPMTRPELAKATGMAKGWSALLGAHTKADGGQSGDKGLIARGYVATATVEGTSLTAYQLTDKGKEAAAK